MAGEHVLIAMSPTEAGQLIARTVLRPAGYKITMVEDQQQALTALESSSAKVVLLSDKFANGEAITWAAKILRKHPFLRIILLSTETSEQKLISAIRAGMSDCLNVPINPESVLKAVRGALDQHKRLEERSSPSPQPLQKRLDELEALSKIGRSITASLDLDEVLTMVVDAAVELTEAEEGSLLLVDESSGDLYMRAAKNFQDEFVRTFRLPIDDTLAGQVVQTGLPVLIDQSAPQKIKTAYLVNTLVYVPLKIKAQIIGVLGVDNRTNRMILSDHHIVLLSALADYAAIAIENANLYTRTETDRSKLETILKKIEEGVIVLDHEGRLILVNRIAREAFSVGEGEIYAQPAQKVFQHQELLDSLQEKKNSYPYQVELQVEDGRVFNAQFTPIREVGLVVTMQNITHLKELDRIKSEFVSAVSHDLRSPLTAILGYVELIERAGAVNDQQRDFIRRVHLNVNSITALINDLLDLGRIEAGLDARKEVVPIPGLINYAVDSLQSRIAEKGQALELDGEEGLASVLGNPVHLRQVVGNLIGNAVKYTQPGGKIQVTTRSEGEQVILRVSDNGPGIPPAEQPYIFDKFYRGSAVPADTPGTGLGLAIVRSVVENHQGRVWVESKPEEGTTFTVVLPVADPA